MELYIHIPFCMKKCLYCDFLSGVYSRDVQGKYAKKLIEELKYYGAIYRDEVITSVYIGGGTPTWLPSEWMLEIIDTVNTCFKLDPDVEFTMEANPGTANKETLAVYKRNGVDRLSIGLQSANNDELETLGRCHDVERFLSMYQGAKEAGFYNINVDIMTGLPGEFRYGEAGQSPEKLMQTLETVTSLRPTHISAYSLMIEEGTPFYEKYHEDEVRQSKGYPTMHLPREKVLLYLTELLEDNLKNNGYVQYEISNFAHPGFECVHNIGYWTRVPYIGVGLGAASLIRMPGNRVGDTYMTNLEIRTQNTPDMETYLYTDISGGVTAPILPRGNEEYQIPYLSALWDSATILTRHDAMAEFMFLGLRMTQGVSRDEFKERFNLTIESAYGDVLHRFEDEGLLSLEGGRIFITEKGRPISNVVMREFL